MSAIFQYGWRQEFATTILVILLVSSMTLTALSMTYIFNIWTIIYNISVLDVADAETKVLPPPLPAETTVHVKQMKQRQTQAPDTKI